MSPFVERAESLARAAQRRRLKQIAAGFRGPGVAVEIGADAVVFRARGLAKRWLTDPIFRFAGRSGS